MRFLARAARRRSPRPLRPALACALALVRRPGPTCPCQNDSDRIEHDQLRTSVTTNESDLAWAPCGDLTRACGIPGMRCGSMRVGMIDTQAIRQRWQSVGSKLDERGRRVFAAGEARAAGWGGVAALSAITGLARSTIGRGLKDLDAAPLPKGQERRKGGGRRHLSSRDATLIEDLHGVIEPATLGDPMRHVEKPRQGGRRVAEEGPRDQRQQREETVADARL